MDSPRLRPVISRILRLNSASASPVHRIFPLFTVNPKNPHWLITATQLFFWLTVSFSRLFSHFTRLSITRSPARALLTCTTRSSAYLAQRWPLFSSSLSRSFSKILLNRGDRGDPCGTPFSVGCHVSASITPAFKYRWMSFSRALSFTRFLTLLKTSS